MTVGRPSLWSIAVLLLLLFPAPNAQGQFRSGTSSALSLALGNVVFTLDEADPSVNFQFDDTVVGAVLSRQGIYASIMKGSSRSNAGARATELDLFDVSLAISGSLFRDKTDHLPVYFPIMLHSTYRRVRRVEGINEFAAFEYTGLGLGAGLGIRRSGDTWQIDAHGTPGIGIASRSFGNSTGSTVLFDGDIQFMAGPFFQRFGVALGYNYRWQSWKVGGPDAFDVAGSGRVRYSGSSQTFRVGVSW
jgi:hypothetical protein